MGNYEYIETIGYLVAITCFLITSSLFFYGKIPRKMRLLKKDKEIGVPIIKSEILIKNEERIRVEEDEEKNIKRNEQITDFDYMHDESYRTTKLKS